MNHRNDRDSKNGLVRILDLPLAALRPARENDRLYRPVDPDDPEIRRLAASILEHGVKEALVITLDNVILSGHRRYAACKLAGLTMVPCRRENIHSTAPEFLPLLREYNRQRVKSLDEVLREAVVSANPEEAYRRLRQERQCQARVKVETIAIEGHKHRAKITAAKEPFLRAIQAILEDYANFLPLSVRQIHYYLLNAPPRMHASKPGSIYRNNIQSYKSLDELVTRARIAGLIDFDAIHDPTRPVVTWDVHRHVGTFIQGALNDFLKGYYRDLMQSQPNHIEIIGEKNTIEGVLRPVAMEYAIPYTIGRGYSSLPPRYDMWQRFGKSGKENLLLLVLSDFDPEGEDIGHSFARSMRDDFEIDHILPVKVALTSKQVQDLRLPPQLKVKEGSSRSAKFRSRHGDDVYELESVPPERLQTILRQAIDSVIDIDAFNAEVKAEKQNAAQLEELRRVTQEHLSRLNDFDSD
jgi:hypothetical protein